ncbi:hypothetical protein CCH79_00018279 [Gambusia affinis]|uniref:Serine protease n=1 Tax=Gambusia affinis TaxID=33528 RepID=A0A315VXI9_GAMAF|nr:hypothetical protein CCH79_00018279 [Gambusia affinis]
MRFPGRSFEETLKLKKENFGKIQNSFSKVHTVRELLKLSKSVCLLMIEEKNNSGLTELKKTVKGTGFVLFDNFVLTNAHLFKPWEKISNWRNYLNITAEFNFDNKPGMKYQAALVCRTHDFDFALLELIQIHDLQELKEKHPGLLKIFGPMPGGDSGACIIGHPGGGVKKMDITCIIRKEDRKQKVKETLEYFKSFIICRHREREEMKTSAKRKRTINKTDNKTDCDKENVSPDEVSSPPKKKRSPFPGVQISDCHLSDLSDLSDLGDLSDLSDLGVIYATKDFKFLSQTKIPLGTNNTNGSRCLLDNPRPRPVNPGVNKMERMIEEGLKRDLNGQLSEKSPESISPSRNRVDMHFPKTYKARSPTNKQEKNNVENERGRVKADEPPGCQSEAMDISELPADCKLEAPNLSDEEFLRLLKEIEVSVCKIVVLGVSQGTGFVWCGRLILTSAHLFRGCLDGRKLVDNIKVSVDFELETVNPLYTVEKIFLDIDEELDYAIFELIPEDPTAEKVKFPPGLLKRLGPVLKSGGVSLIGFPAGREKTIRRTTIVEAENREQVVKDLLDKYYKFIFTQTSIKQIITNQGIGGIMKNGTRKEQVITYHCPMYDGTSGSPVIDGRGQVIGLHTGGYDYGFTEFKNHVIEFAISLPTIFKKFVSNLRKRGEKEQLERIREEVSDNDYVTRLMFSPE